MLALLDIYAFFHKCEITSVHKGNFFKNTTESVSDSDSSKTGYSSALTSFYSIASLGSSAFYSATQPWTVTPLQSRYALYSIVTYDTKAQHTNLKQVGTRSKFTDSPFPNNATLSSQCLLPTPPYET